MDNARRYADFKTAVGSALWLERQGETVDDYAFLSRIDRSAALSTGRYARLVDEWVSASDFDVKNTLQNRSGEPDGLDQLQGHGKLRAVQILLGHTKIENTVRHLGVDAEDAFILAEGIAI